MVKFSKQNPKVQRKNTDKSTLLFFFLNEKWPLWIGYLSSWDARDGEVSLLERRHEVVSL